MGGYTEATGEVIEMTPNHPSYTAEGWKVAGNLEAGDHILALDDSYGVVESVVIVMQVQAMYDLTVEEAHTFAVGEGEWVVHNCGGGSTGGIQTRDFAHASSFESIQDILRNGLNENAAKASFKGGSVNRPGSFFTVEVTSETYSDIGSGLITFGMRHSKTPVLLVMQLPETLFKKFQDSGAIENRVWGEYVEAIFSPSTFSEINQGISDGTIYITIIDKFKDQR